jgi:putative oxidoreductase
VKGGSQGIFNLFFDEREGEVVANGRNSMGGWQAFASLIGRILLVLIFLQSGIGKIGNLGGTVEYMAKYGMPFPSFFLLGAIFLEVFGSVSVILGYFTQAGAVLLIVFLIPTTLIFHTDFSDRMQVIHFMKNVSMLGGCFILLGQGPGRFSIDHFLRPQRGRR